MSDHTRFNEDIGAYLLDALDERRARARSSATSRAATNAGRSSTGCVPPPRCCRRPSSSSSRPRG